MTNDTCTWASCINLWILIIPLTCLSWSSGIILRQSIWKSLRALEKGLWSKQTFWQLRISSSWCISLHGQGIFTSLRWSDRWSMRRGVLSVIKTIVFLVDYVCLFCDWTFDFDRPNSPDRIWALKRFDSWNDQLCNWNVLQGKVWQS